jgi:preprotein translocase subunit SecY
MNTNLQNTKSRSLRYRIFLTVSLLTLVRLGCFIPVPFLDKDVFTSLLQVESNINNPAAQALSTFSGTGNLSFGLLSLGILPYINASIVIQLLSTAIPSLSKMQKEEGEYGRRKLTDYVRYLTLVWAVIESIGITNSLRSIIFDWNWWTAIQISITMISGSMIVLWFSELISRDGLGNGSSLLICFNIVSSLPDQITSFFNSLNKESDTTNSSMIFFLLIGVFILTTLGCIYINEALIKIPIVSARQLLKKTKIRSKGLGNSTLPLRINQAGVMPLVFTSYSMTILSSFAQLIKKQEFPIKYFTSLIVFDENISYWFEKILFWSFYAGLIFFFTYFYSTLVLDPKEVAERFRKNSVVILGIQPGNSTRSYLSQTLKRIASINAFFLIFNIIGLQLIESVLNLNVISLRGLGFTSQLILVNVVIDTVKRIRSFLNEEEKML